MIFCFSYPPDEAKVLLANAIITEFPLLKNNMTGCKGYVSAREKFLLIYISYI